MFCLARSAASLLFWAQCIQTTVGLVQLLQSFSQIYRPQLYNVNTSQGTGTTDGPSPLPYSWHPNRTV